MALELADKVNADIVIVTNPNCDRLGIAIRISENELQMLNGNQTFLVMTSFQLKQWKNKIKLKVKNLLHQLLSLHQCLPILANHYGVESKIENTMLKV